MIKTMPAATPRPMYTESNEMQFVDNTETKMRTYKKYVRGSGRSSLNDSRDRFRKQWAQTEAHQVESTLSRVNLFLGIDFSREKKFIFSLKPR